MISRQEILKLAWRSRGLIAVPLSVILVYILRLSGGLQGLELAAFDQYMRMRTPATSDEPIKIVGIDEEDVKAIGSPPFSDQVYAQLLQKLLVMQPRAIALDIYRDVPVEPGNSELVKIFQSHDNIIGIEKVVGRQAWERVAPPPSLKEKRQIGANDLPPDRDGKIRRVIITLKSEGETIPSLGTSLAVLYLDAEGKEVDWAKFPPFEPNDGGYVDTAIIGYQIILNYRGSNRHFEIVSITDILNSRVPPDWGRDRLIFIGNVSESFNDLLATPYTTTADTRMAGVEIHANVASQIINTVITDYPVIKTWSELSEWVWISIWSLLGTIIIWQKRYVFFSGLNSLWLILPTILLPLITYVAFLGGYWLPLIPPLFAVWGAQLAIIFYMAYQGTEIRQTFGRYLNHKVVADLVENRQSLKIGGKKQKVTILVSDLRGFTATSEQKPPEQVVEVLNYYFGQMAEVIAEYDGMIDEFLGDGILVLFDVPIFRKDDAVRAIACAIAMQQRLKIVNETIKDKYPGFPPLNMGIGINTGEVIVGNIGSEKRTKYGVVGNAINITYRIESCTIGGQIFISEATLAEAENIPIYIHQSLSKHFKGAKESQTIYDIKGIGGKYNLFLDSVIEVFYLLPQPIPLTYKLVEGKDINETKVKGKLVELSENGGRLLSQIEQCNDLLPRLANIMCNFLDSDLANPEDCIYAKVLEQNSQNQQIEIAFTSVPPHVKVNLNRLYEQLLKSASENL